MGRYIDTLFILKVGMASCSHGWTDECKMTVDRFCRSDNTCGCYERLGMSGDQCDQPGVGTYVLLACSLINLLVYLHCGCVALNVLRLKIICKDMKLNAMGTTLCFIIGFLMAVPVWPLGYVLGVTGLVG